MEDSQEEESEESRGKSGEDMRKTIELDEKRRWSERSSRDC